MQDLVLSKLASTVVAQLALLGTNTGLFLPLLSGYFIVLLLDPLSIMHEQVIEFPSTVVHVLLVVVDEDGAHDHLIKSPQEVGAFWLFSFSFLRLGFIAA